MACACGCGQNLSSLSRRRARGLGRSRLAIGSSVAEQFDFGSYVPQGIQDDVATGQAYYNQFQQATQGTVTVGSNGSIHVSDQAAYAYADAVAGVVAAAIPILGTAFAVLMAVAPHAGAGPGTCANPPAGPLPSQLVAWPHFTPWASPTSFPRYNPGAPGSFEAFANPILEYNWLLWANCFSNKWTPPAILLASLIASWNATHAGPSRTITRTGLVQSGFVPYPSGYDPIAEALESALLAKYTAPDQTFEQATSGAGGYSGPYNAASSFQVNAGGLLLKKVLTLHLPPAKTATAQTMAPAPAAASSGPSGATIAVVGIAAAAALWGWHQHAARKAFFPKNLTRKLPRFLR